MNLFEIGGKISRIAGEIGRKEPEAANTYYCETVVELCDLVQTSLFDRYPVGLPEQLNSFDEYKRTHLQVSKDDWVNLVQSLTPEAGGQLDLWIVKATMERWKVEGVESTDLSDMIGYGAVAHSKFDEELEREIINRFKCLHPELN